MLDMGGFLTYGVEMVGRRGSMLLLCTVHMFLCIFHQSELRNLMIHKHTHSLEQI